MQRPTFIARQAARPAGIVGRLLLRVMSLETSRFNAAVLDALAPSSGDRILEVGYGHGRTLAAAAQRAPDAWFSGIDLSSDAARVTARRCRMLPAERLDLRVGDSAAMPWVDGSFDKVFSVHTIYFWSEPSQHLREMCRVLRPGGRLALGFRERDEAVTATFPAEVYRFPSVDEVSSLLVAAGFDAVNVDRGDVGPGLCIATAVAGHAPSSPT